MTESQRDDETGGKDSACARLIPARFVFAILGCIGFGIIYGLKVNLSVAIVAMVNQTAIKSQAAHDLANINISAAAPLCQPEGSSNKTEVRRTTRSTGKTRDLHAVCFWLLIAQQVDGPFEWDSHTQGLILGSYFWGYPVTQIPGGRAAELYSARRVMLIAMLINALATVLTPVAANSGVAALIAVRIAEGLGAGLTFPAMDVLISKWAPPNERSTISSIIFAGTALGTVASMLSAGVLAGCCGWESIFYVMGAVAFLWCILWELLVADSPSKQRHITRKERALIEDALAGQVEHAENLSVPWKSVLTSGPFYAILISHVCSNFGWYMLLIELPTYMNQVLLYEIKQNAVLSSLPFLVMWVFSTTQSRLIELMRSRGLISVTTARKISTSIASAIPAICLVAVSYVGCNRGWAVFLMGLAVVSMGAMFSGFLANHVDIAPNFAGTLMAITNTAATIPGFVVPLFVGKLTEHDHSIDAWRIIFLTTSVLLVIEFFAYVLMGSGEEQSWNRPSKPLEPIQQTPLLEGKTPSRQHSLNSPEN